jgi:serine/threonine-protein kinase
MVRPLTPDARAIDATARYLLPYPVASLYRLAHGSHRAGDRFGFSIRFVEGTLRFLALISAADAVACGAPAKKIGKWLRMLEAPGMGKLMAMFRSTSKAARNSGSPFMPETAQLVDSEWEEAAGRLIEIRNRWTKDDVYVKDAEAPPLLAAIEEPLRALVAGLAFLADYRLGTAMGLRRSGSAFTCFFYTSRGLEETCEPVKLRLGEPLIDDMAMLIHPERGAALYLEPFFHWGLATGDRASHILWLHSILKADDGSRVGRYRPPVLRHELVRSFVDPDDPDGEGVGADVYLERTSEWPGRVDLRLDDDSVRALRDASQPGAFQDRYRVIGRLGEGGMGTVWDVEDISLDRRCAMKILRKELLRSRDALKRFVREGKLLAKVSHPGVVDVYDVGLDDDQIPYIVMELVEGDDLAACLDRQGAYSIAEATRVICRALEALTAIHDLGIVHRDIKPRNFIIAGDRVVLVDFGIATLPEGTKLTRTMDRIGTPEFTAPEQWMGRATPQSDIYSCGRVLFCMLAGRMPERPTERLVDAVPTVPARLNDVYSRAIAENPADRFRTAAEFAEALEMAAEDAETDGAKAAGRYSQITVVMCDIRDYTAASDGLPPEVLIESLNEYVGAMTRVLRRHDGFLDKVVGDEIIALFGVTGDPARAPLAAVRCAAEMRDALTGLNEVRAKANLFPIETSTVVHTGRMVVGAVGPAGAARFTAMGDAMNAAAYLTARGRGGEILISGSTYDNVAGDVDATELDPAEIPDQDPLPIYRVDRIRE